MTNDFELHITGTTGFVGAALLRHFAAAGYRVSGSGRSAAPKALLDIAAYHQADISRPIAPMEADVVVHAAALASDSASAAALLLANVTGVRHVFEATQSCPLFIYISSSSVYDNHQSEHREEEPVDVQLLSAYGRSKRMAEDWLIAQDWSRRTLVVLRPRAVYGKGDRQLLPRLMRLVRGGRIFIPGDMRVQSSLTHIGNLCAAAEVCLQHFTQHPGGIHLFNVADAAPYDMREAVDALLSGVYGRKLAFVELPLAPLRAFAGIMEQWRIPTSFTPLSLASVSQHNILYLDKITQTIGFQSHLNLWNDVGNISTWAKQVGIKALRSADPLLPWR
ncbi:MAG: NAD(P)-dependent oxidoreductase [Saprospiraceae bacterium]|nr:NAD(P)-dependent oxidoreductase [Saprospiraceae bacterium]